MKLEVKEIGYKQAKKWLLNYHYAKRVCNVMHSFGLFDKERLVGVVTYGMPPSATLCSSICGKELKGNVLELNRLITMDNLPKNSASYFVSKSIKMISKDVIVVSFADANQNHNGYIYQATNFIYTGVSSNTSKLVDKFGAEFHFRNIGHYQKNNKLNVGLVKRRDKDFSLDKNTLVGYLKENKGSYTYKAIDKIFGYKDTASHWFRTDAGHSYPSVDDYVKLKDILGLDNRFDKELLKYVMIPCPNEIKEKLELKKVLIKPKHRYVLFSGSKGFKRRCKKEFKLNTLPYPKGENKNYSIDFSGEEYKLF